MADDTTTNDTTTAEGGDVDKGQGGQETSATDTSTGADQLGGAGKAALDKERKARQEAEKRARDLEKKVKNFEDANKSDLDKATSRAETAEQRATALIDRAVKAEIRAAAADQFADPSDAAAFLDTTAYVGDAGDVDTDKIKADLADLLKRKPHLGKRNGPKPDPTQGAKPGGTPDLASRIAEAEKAGDVRTAIALKNQQLFGSK
ncbi:hypothetical protein [Nonomuraea sediminis]|uniref:hypothetical protein n=1 Tax=Nonomuraea sediminis TaxID=2835864 RepID=UPI001BDC86AB|nr:hypothetical protein [Nonomuraea sediminis]